MVIFQIALVLALSTSDTSGQSQQAKYLPSSAETQALASKASAIINAKERAKAWEDCRKAAAKRADTQGEAICFAEGARALSLTKRYEAAFDQFRAAEVLFQKSEDIYGLAVCDQGQAAYHRRMGEVALAKQRFTSAAQRFEKAGSRLDAAHCIRSLAIMMFYAGAQMPDLIPLVLKSTTLFAGTDADQVKLQSLLVTAAGKVYTDPKGAVSTFRESLALAERIGDVEAQQLSLGGILANSDDIRDAALVEHSRVLSEEVGDVGGMAWWHRGKALYHMAKAEPRKALASLNAAGELYAQIGNVRDLAAIKVMSGGVFDHLNDSTRALALYREALQMFKDVGDKPGQIRSLEMIGLDLKADGDIPGALECFNQAVKMAKETNDLSGRAALTEDLASVASHQGDFPSALALFREAADLFQRAGDPSNAAAMANNLADIFADMGDKQTARRIYEESLKTFEKLDSRLAIARTITALGVLDSGSGDSDSAFRRFEQALKIRIDAEDSAGQGWSHFNIGWEHLRFGDLTSAQREFLQAETLMTAAHSSSGQAAALNGRSVALERSGKLTEALGLAKEALDIHRKAGNLASIGTMLNNIGLIYNRLGDPNKAIDYYRESLATHRKTNNRVGEAFALDNLGSVYSAAGETEAALGHFQSAILLWRACDLPEGEATSLNNIAWAYYRKKEYAKASLVYKQSVAMLQTLRQMQKPLPQEMRDSFSRSRGYTYRNLYDCLVQQGRFPEADRALELLEGEQVRSGERFTPEEPGASPAMIEFTETEHEFVVKFEDRVQDVVKKKLAASRAQLGLVAEPGKVPDPKADRAAEEESKAAYFDWLKSATAEFKGYKPNQYEADRLAYDDRLSGLCFTLTNQTQKNTAALSVTVYEDKTLAVLYLGPDQTNQKFTAEITVDQLATRIKKVIDCASDPARDPVTESSKLLKDLLGPLLAKAREAKVQVLMTLLNGPVRSLPWQAMWDGETGQWLGDEFLLPRVTSNSRDYLLMEAAPKWRVVAFGNDLGLDGKTRDIPGAVDEVKALPQATPKVGPSEFNLESFKAAMADKAYNVIHVASHFLLVPGSDKKSFLLLGDGSRFSVFDMKKTASIGYGNCELLVLSACKTAVSSGDSSTIEGLAANAENKGAKAVIATLWSVNDTATRKLLTKFYEVRLADPSKTKLQCLAEAERLMRTGQMGDPNSEGWNNRDRIGAKPKASAWKGPGLHPYYWAGFILFGNWK